MVRPVEDEGLSPLMDDPTLLPPPCYTKERADQIYGEAFRRAMEFVTYQRIPGDVLEFGTLNGYTARKLAELMVEIGHPGNLVLFDSFEGMPAVENPVDRECPEIAAGAWRPGTPRTRIPDVEHQILDRLGSLLGDRVRIVKGWYRDTVDYLDTAPPSIVHLDCDLYESTLTVWEALGAGRLWQQGQIILFDDYNSGRGSWEFGQRAATGPRPIAGAHQMEPWFSYGWHGQSFIVHA